MQMRSLVSFVKANGSKFDGILRSPHDIIKDDLFREYLELKIDFRIACWNHRLRTNWKLFKSGFPKKCIFENMLVLTWAGAQTSTSDGA